MSQFNATGSMNPGHEIGQPRKHYSKPVLERLGDLRTLTLGGSPGIGDSSIDPQKPYAGDTIPTFPLPDEFKPPEDPYYPPL